MNIKLILQKLKSPPKWLSALTFCFAILFAGLSISFVVLGLSNKIYAYIVYAIAGISLAYAIYLIVRFIPNIKKNFINKLQSNKFTKRIYEDYKYRTVVFAVSSLIVNFLFGVFEMVMGAVAMSIWFGALGAYHLILSFTRFGVVYRYYQQSKRNDISKLTHLNTYRNTGVCILVFNIALAGAMGQMIFSYKAFEYVGLMIYVMSAYAFYKISISIYGMIKAKNFKDYGTQSLRNLKVTDAMVSIYALQTALIATFNEEQGTNMSVMNIITGVVVTTLSISIGVYMIVKSYKEKNKLKKEKING